MYFVYFSLGQHPRIQFPACGSRLAIDVYMSETSPVTAFATNFRIKLFKKQIKKVLQKYLDQKVYKKCGFVGDMAPSKINPAIQPRFISVGVPKHHDMLIAFFPKHLKAENIQTHWKKILSKLVTMSHLLSTAAVAIINSIFRTNYDFSPFLIYLLMISPPV